jgi:hypothetical protein
VGRRTFWWLYWFGGCWEGKLRKRLGCFIMDADGREGIACFEVGMVVDGTAGAWKKEICGT